MGFLDRFKRKDDVRSTVPSEPLKAGTNYFVAGESVVFKIGELNYTHEKFYLAFDDQKLILEVKDEVSMNLQHILTAAKDEIGINQRELDEADMVEFTLQLQEELFQNLKNQFTGFNDPVALFDLEHEEAKPLRDLANYTLEGYRTRAILE